MWPFKKDECVQEALKYLRDRGQVVPMIAELVKKLRDKGYDDPKIRSSILKALETYYRELYVTIVNAKNKGGRYSNEDPDVVHGAESRVKRDLEAALKSK